MTEIKTDVLIVGTGPAGSSTAALLSSYGIDNVLINNYSWLSGTPRAHITNQRTMEVLRDLGKNVETEAYLHATDQDLMGEREHKNIRARYQESLMPRYHCRSDTKLQNGRGK